MVSVRYERWGRREMSGMSFLKKLWEAVGAEGLMAREGLVLGKSAYWGQGL